MSDQFYDERDQYFMSLALEQAEAAYKQDEVPVGAVIAVENSLLASACNQIEGAFDATSHAELLAIRSASAALGRWRLTGCTLYVTLEPCPMCAGAIRLSRLSRVVFGASDQRMGGGGSLVNLFEQPQLGPPIEVKSGVLAEDCSAILKRFFRERRSSSAEGL